MRIGTATRFRAIWSESTQQCLADHYTKGMRAAFTVT
jgi:hypothetical protein